MALFIRYIPYLCFQFVAENKEFFAVLAFFLSSCFFAGLIVFFSVCRPGVFLRVNIGVYLSNAA